MNHEEAPGTGKVSGAGKANFDEISRSHLFALYCTHKIDSGQTHPAPTDRESVRNLLGLFAFGHISH